MIQVARENTLEASLRVRLELNVLDRESVIELLKQDDDKCGEWGLSALKVRVTRSRGLVYVQTLDPITSQVFDTVIDGPSRNHQVSRQ